MLCSWVIYKDFKCRFLKVCVKVGFMLGVGVGNKVRFFYLVWSRCWGGSWFRYRNKGSFSIFYEIVCRMGDKWAGVVLGIK